ncbi:hypothetical protein QEN19_001538 [Hanseniaspora menglaensis]
MSTENASSRLTFSIGTAGNNVGTSLMQKNQDSVIKILDDGSTKHNNTGNLYTKGIEVFKENKESIYQNVRHFLESSTVNRIDETNLINSMAGGLGSSVPLEIINLLTDSFGFNKTIFSNALLWGNNDSVLESYNQLLYISDVHKRVDLITCFDNSFYDSSQEFQSGLPDGEPGFKAVNDEISDSLINAFLNKSEKLVNLKSYDGSLKFYIPSTSISEKRLFENQSQLFNVKSKSQNNLVYHGNIIFSSKVDKMLLFDINKLLYANDSMKICSFVQQENSRKNYLVSNNNGILDSLQNLLLNFEKFFEKGAFLQYFLESVSRDEFLERKEILLNIIEEYRKL